jgi:hypothetical protein
VSNHQTILSNKSLLISIRSHDVSFNEDSDCIVYDGLTAFRLPTEGKVTKDNRALGVGYEK